MTKYNSYVKIHNHQRGIYYEKRDSKKLCLANRDNISIIFPKQSSYDMLKKICNDPYKVYKLVNNGYLTYNLFISPYADNKTKNIIKKIIY